MTDMTALENGTGPDTMWSLNGTADRVANKVAEDNLAAARFNGLTRLDLLIGDVAVLAVQTDPAALDAALAKVIADARAWRAVL